MGKRKTHVFEPVQKMTYRQAYDLFMKDEKAFRAEYTRQRDQAKKQLERLQKSGGSKAQIAQDFLKGVGPHQRGKILKLSELDADARGSGKIRSQIASDYAHAMININTAIFTPRASLRGWKGILQKIRNTLEENGYGKISRHQLELMGEVMARVYAIYGRKYAPSEEVMEAIAACFGEEMLKMSDDQLQEFLNKWDTGDRGNAEMY